MTLPASTRATALRPDPDPAADRRLFREGDRAAFERLARPHLDLLYTLCLRMVGSEADARDLAQEALLKAWSHRDRYDPERAFRPWLLTIGSNACLDRVRSVWWTRVVPFSSPRTAVRRSPAGEVSALERDRLVRHALATLPAHYREAVSLFHLRELDYREMAEITGVSIAALKQRVRRGRSMLASAVSEMYPELVPDRTR